MKEIYFISMYNLKTGIENNLLTYNSLDEFIDNFPFAERQDKEQVERELNKKGYFKFGDFDSPHQYILSRI